MCVIAREILVEERAALRASWKDGVVAFETAPFGEVVGDVEGGGGRGRVFVVDEGDGVGLVGIGECGRRRLDDYVGGEEVAVAED